MTLTGMLTDEIALTEEKWETGSRPGGETGEGPLRNPWGN
jgi:hypothetical protein